MLVDGTMSTWVIAATYQRRSVSSEVWDESIQTIQECANGIQPFAQAHKTLPILG